MPHYYGVAIATHIANFMVILSPMIKCYDE